MTEEPIELETYTSEEETIAKDETISIFITVNNGEVVSIVTNRDDLDIEVIDEDIEDVCKETAEANMINKRRMENMIGQEDTYEYVTKKEED